MPYDGTWQHLDPAPAYGWPVTRVLIVEDERLLLRTEPSRPRHLLTEPGTGYRFQP